MSKPNRRVFLTCKQTEFSTKCNGSSASQAMPSITAAVHHDKTKSRTWSRNRTIPRYTSDLHGIQTFDASSRSECTLAELIWVWELTLSYFVSNLLRFWCFGVCRSGFCFALFDSTNLKKKWSESLSRLNVTSRCCFESAVISSCKLAESKRDRSADTALECSILNIVILHWLHVNILIFTRSEWWLPTPTFAFACVLIR